MGNSYVLALGGDAFAPALGLPLFDLGVGALLWTLGDMDAAELEVALFEFPPKRGAGDAITAALISLCGFREVEEKDRGKNEKRRRPGIRELRECSPNGE